MPSPPSPFTATLAPRFRDLGPDGRLGVVALGNLLQDLAGEHAAALDLGLDRLLERGVGWVLSRLRLRVEQAPGPEPLHAETWPSAVLRQGFLRSYRLLTPGGEVLVEALGLWVLIDLETRHAIEPPEWVGARVPEVLPPAVTFERRTISAFRAPPDHVARITPRRAELDLNGHVNNAHALGWILEPLPASLGTTPADLDILYRNELRPEDRFSSEAAEVEPGLWRHGIRTEGEGRECVRAITRWPTPAS